jgi:hypothetical protein
MQQPISVFNISPDDNRFVFGTPFEALLLLKNLVFIVRTSDERTLLKTAFLDLFLAQSPFVLRYLAKFAEHLSLQMPSSPYDSSPAYHDRLVLVGCYLQRGIFSPRITHFFRQESRILTNPFAREISRYFPEFLTTKPEPPTSPNHSIIPPPLDASSLQVDHAGTILSFRFFIRQYDSLIGFPFWEILPYWVRLCGVPETEVQPIRERLAHGVLQITNPSQNPIQGWMNGTWTNSSMVFLDHSRDFLSPDVRLGNSLRLPFAVGPGQTVFLSLIEHESGWESIQLYFTRANYTQTRLDLNMNDIHDQFVSDMKSFAVDCVRTR